MDGLIPRENVEFVKMDLREWVVGHHKIALKLVMALVVAPMDKISVQLFPKTKRDGMDGIAPMSAKISLKIVAM